MPDTFSLFSLLPFQLREHIWQFAIRDTCPGVHYIRSPEFSQEEASGSVDRASYNPSTYAMDGGLWGVCRESRLVLERAFRDQDWAVIREDQLRGHIQWQPLQVESSETSMQKEVDFVRQLASSHRAFTVLPQQDLLLLQIHDTTEISRNRLDFSDPFQLSRQGLKGFRNVAIEFDLAWDIEVQKTRHHPDKRYLEALALDIVQIFVKAAYDAVDEVKLWFIDYGIQRHHWVPTQKEATMPDGQVFYADRRRFVEVRYELGTDSPLDNWWETIYELDDDIDAACFMFISDIRDAIDTLYWDEREEHDNFEWGSSCGSEYSLRSFPQWPQLTFGVLACQYD